LPVGKMNSCSVIGSGAMVAVLGMIYCS
jgi:hypothetical protein